MLASKVMTGLVAFWALLLFSLSAASHTATTPCTNGLAGYENENVCCVEECGQCGGSGCSTIPGLTGDDCCTGNIKKNNELCSDTGAAPCVIIPDPPTPSPVAMPMAPTTSMCSNGFEGIESSGACCVADCGQCGGSGCSTISGFTGDDCCTANILAEGELCFIAGEAPCIIDESTPAPMEGSTPAPVDARTPAPVDASTPAPVDASTMAPVVDPTMAPVVDPTMAPAVDPTMAPVVDPTMAPAVDPTMAPAVDPTMAPVVDPTMAPVIDPTMAPAVDPTMAPAVDPTMAPAVEPTMAPAVDPTMAPAVDPTIDPTMAPAVDPTMAPAVEPTMAPVVDPTMAPGFCSNGLPGVEAENVCCPADCGTCGGKGCRSRGESCCISAIVVTNDMCSDTEAAPCILDTDGECSNGISGLQTGNACCPTRCGTCGGKGCSVRGTGCCVSEVLDGGVMCSDSGASPCIVEPDEASTCSNGLAGYEMSGVCCSAACGTCGGIGCNNLGDGCCIGAIMDSNVMCSAAGAAPCII